MLQNVYLVTILLAKIGFDTAENETFKITRKPAVTAEAEVVLAPVSPTAAELPAWVRAVLLDRTVQKVRAASCRGTKEANDLMN